MSIKKMEKIGNQTLILGDCLEVMPTLGRFDACVTDPPYGIDYGSQLKGKGDGKGGADRNGWKSYDCPDWDKERPAPEVFEAMLSISKDQIIWGGNYFADLLPASQRWLCWDKGQRDFSLADIELAWTSQDKASRAFTYARSKALQDGKEHPTQKPLALMEWCLGFVPKAKTVIDPFCGSGTLLVACQRLGLQGTGIEISPDYFDIACRRVEEATRQPDLFIAPTVKPTQEAFGL